MEIKKYSKLGVAKLLYNKAQKNTKLKSIRAKYSEFTQLIVKQG